MFFFNNCIENNQNKTHFEEGSSSHTSLGDESGYQIGQQNKNKNRNIKVLTGGGGRVMATVLDFMIFFALLHYLERFV